MQKKYKYIPKHISKLKISRHANNQQKHDSNLDTKLLVEINAETLIQRS